MNMFSSSSSLLIADIITDEKFIDSIIDKYNILGKDVAIHEYLLISDYPVCFKYIKKKEYIKIISPKNVISYLNNSSFDAVVLHSLYSMPLKLIPQIASNIKVFWCAWGFDIYNKNSWLPLIDIELYKPLTKKSLKLSLKSKVKNILKYTPFKMFYTYPIKRAVNRIDFFSGVLDSEYELMKRNKFFRAVKFKYSYFTPKNLHSEDDIYTSINSGPNILLGNSADPTNNHLDIIPELSKINLKERKIIVPLSYADKNNRLNVIEIGQRLLGNNFYPLTDFIPFDEYKKNIESASVSIFYHERQQAMGNIYLSIWNGNKVFLSETSITYKFLIEKGFKIYSVQKDLNEVEISEKMSLEDIYNNRKIIVRGHNNLINELHDFYELVKSSSSREC